MSARPSSRKGRILNTSEINTHINSIDTSSDLAFLIGYIHTDDILLWTLLSGQITNLSFSDLYDKSQSIGWKQVLIELRNNLKLDEKTKPKRFTLNRLIYECSTNGDIFNVKVTQFNEKMKKQLSNCVTAEQECFNRLQTITDVYNEVTKWKQLQCERRLFHKEYNRRCSLLTLQQLMTDYFISLVQSPEVDVETLKQLFNHCLIIVVQPSGTDCFAVTKYEKVGEAFVAKIKTRIICLLDPHRIRKYLEVSDVEVKLYLKDRTLDPEGDVQAPLPWRTRTIKCDNNGERTFWYIELNENDSIKLTKKSSNRKLLYNNGLCQLEFHMKFKLIGTNSKISVKLNSQCFGLCSHAKYSSKYLTKVFLEEIKTINKEINLNTHISTLEGYIYEFHKRISGVDAKPHTRQFIREELTSIYQAFLTSAASRTGPVMFFSFNIYEGIFDKFFSQMKFMGSHPFLSMMYFDGLFLGICADTVDIQLNSSILKKPQLVMRFSLFKEQETPDNPNIIFAVHNGTLLKSRVTHGYLIHDMSTCICAAAQNEGNQIVIYDHSKTSPFASYVRYYDLDLSRDNLIQTKNETKYFPLNTLLRNTMRNDLVQSQTPDEQQNIIYTFDLAGQLRGHEDSITDAIAFLQEQFARWCQIKNFQGSLTRYSLDSVDMSDTDLCELLEEDNIS